jgi:hypothetical protein
VAYEIEQYWASPDTYTRGNDGREWIVVHYTATNASALNNCIYFSGGNRNASAHYFIDDTSIWQSVPEEDSAWHAGNWSINSTSIGIEVVSAGQDFTDGEIDRLAWLVGVLMERYGIDANHVIRHYDVADVAPSGGTLDPHKRCPAPYVDAGKWAWLHDRIISGQGGAEVIEDKDIERFWSFYINGVQARDILNGVNAASNNVNNGMMDGFMFNRLMDYRFGQNNSTFAERIVGIDAAANNVNNCLPLIIGAVEKACAANGVDISDIADQVQAAVAETLEKINLEVKVDK